MTYPNSPQSPAPTSNDPTTILLHSTSAVTVCSGVPGLAGGAAGDTALVQIILLKNAGPATLTIAGFKGEDGTARNVVFSGLATQDVVYDLDNGIYGGTVNTGAAMILTASVADTVLVSLRPA